MKISEVKQILPQLERLEIQLPDGSLVPNHFHVTEVGKVNKEFIDCGGTLRKEEVISFQLWNANDYDHRLHPEKLLHIIELSEKALQLTDSEVEVEYQGESIQKFGLEFDGERFMLAVKYTDCLAKDNCGAPEHKQKLQLQELQSESCCTPGSGCC